MALSAFGVEDGRISKLDLPGLGAKILKPIQSAGSTLKAMPGGIKDAVGAAGPGIGAKTKAVLGVPGVKPTLGVAGGAAGVGLLGNGRRNNQPAY